MARRTFAFGMILAVTLPALTYAGAHATAAPVSAQTTIRPLARVAAAATKNVAVISPNGNQTTTFTPNFNPFVSTPLWPTQYGIYEPLMIYNTIKSKIVPWLATSYTFGKGGKTLTFKLRKGVKWSDGKPFTAADVVYTFNLLKNASGLQGNGLVAVNKQNGYVKSVTASNASTVVFNFKRPYSPGLYDIMQQVIVPQHIWTKVSDPAKAPNPHPVGTGPFTQVVHFTAQAYQLDKNPHYWQHGKPYINGIRVPAMSGNQQMAVSFAQGSLDWAGFTTANIQQSVIAHDPKDLHFWFPLVGGTVLFMLNLTEKPFQNPTVRKAISMSFNRTQMITLGLNGYTKPSDVTGLSAGYRDWKPSNTKSLGTWTTYNPAEANKLLDKAGYKRGSDGIRVAPDGTKMSFKFVMVNGFSDWIAMGPTVVQNLKAIGIEVTQQNMDFPVALNEWELGKFDMSLYFGFEAPTPFNVYQDIMSRATYVPVGQNSGFFNIWRYQNPQADKLLTKWAATSKVSLQKKYSLQLEKLFAQQAPVIPMWTEPQFDEYSTKHFTGWPTPQDPYTVGACATGNAFPTQLIVLNSIKPK